MKQAYTSVGGIEEFQAAREQFAKSMEHLQSAQALGQQHEEVEQWLWAEGMELLRRMFQAHLDYRALKEGKREGLKGEDRIVRKYCREGRGRQLMSLFGEVTVWRKVYSVPGKHSLFPLDGELNLGPDKYSHGLKKRLAEEVAKGSFDEAVSSIEKASRGKVPKRQVEELYAQERHARSAVARE